MSLFDCTHLTGKPGGNGQPWSGCIPGATKFPLWKPSTKVQEIRSAVSGHPFNICAHNEEGVDHPANPTKTEQRAVITTNERIASDSAAAFPGVPVWVYKQPRHLHDSWWRAWKGDKAAKKRVSECQSYNEGMVALGFPGKGIAGVVVDLYDYEYMAACWPDRAKAECSFWTSRGIPVLPALFLRFKKDGQSHGRYYTDREARERIDFASGICNNPCVIFEAPGPNEPPMAYAQWPHRELVESTAKGN